MSRTEVLRDAQGNCDASPKGRRPGFIKVIDDRTLLIPDIGGNRLFQSQWTH
jgi:predicted pyridoxine 5'-phosphate oxidase superfamily flavin-nucleotide-binding protein